MFMKKLLLSTMMLAAGMFAANAQVPYEKMDPANVVEGRYVIAYDTDDATYIMKNEVYQSYYVKGEEYDLTQGEPSADYIFTIAKSGEGYTIKNSDGGYVALVKSGTHTNLKPNESTPFVWTFSGTSDAVVATGDGMGNSYMQFQLFNGKTPEFCGDSRYESPVFYLLDDNTPEGQCAAPVFSLAAGSYKDAIEVELVNREDGATIVYTINDGAEQTYSSAIRLTAAGTYTIKAHAEKDGLTDSKEVSATYKIAPIPYAKMDPANVVEGRYVIAYNTEDATYIMKNEVYQSYYVKGEEYDLTQGEPSADYIFTIAKSGEGYTIKNSDGGYVALVKGTHTNLKPNESTPFVWTFSGTSDAVVATGDGMGNSYMQFQLYGGHTPEFCADSRYESPVFYLLDDNTPENQCKAPSFSLAAGTYWSAQTVRLTTATEGAEVVYTINGGAETVYNAPIELTAADTYEIKAYARKSGMDNSVEVSATYVISSPIMCEDIDDYIFNAEAEAEGSVFEWDFPVIVTGVMPKYTYVKDGAGYAMLIYGSEVPAYEVGDIIPAGIQGEFKNHYGLYEMTNPVKESFGASTSKGNGNPIVMTAGEITSGDMNKVVYLDNVTYVETKAGESITRTAEDATGSIRLWMQKDWDVQTPENGTVVDLVCAVAVNNEDLQVYPMQFRDAFEEPAGVEGVVAGNTVVMTNADGVVVVAAEAAEVSVYTAAGQLVAAENVAAGESVINVPAGFYIVKAGDTVAKVIVK